MNFDLKNRMKEKTNFYFCETTGHPPSPRGCQKNGCQFKKYCERKIEPKKERKKERKKGSQRDKTLFFLSSLPKQRLFTVISIQYESMMIHYEFIM